MSQNNSNNKRIAKNTLFLYIRMMFLMFVTFFTSRVILDKLGIIDYGIQNVVGGMASMFTFFRSSLSNATQRFLSISLGKGDMKETNKIFCQHQTLYILIAVISIIVAELIGLWLLNHKLVIPKDRQIAAFWVFQLTILSLSTTLLSIVYDSVLISREEMKVYSYTGVVEGLAKLAIAYIISVVAFDRLITYSFLLLIVSLGVVSFYAFYCVLNFPEAKYHVVWDRMSVKESFSFISWNMIGTAVWAVHEQGLNILLNMFFGPVVNAARGVAFQINQALNHFTTNFFTAVKPQMMKSYAAGDNEYLFQLFFRSSKFSVYLLWYLSLPVMLCVDVILSIWLKQVPDYTNVFTIWVLAFSLVNTLNNPVWTLALAIGKLKWYIIIGSSVFLLTFPIAYLFLIMGYSPVSVFVVSFFVRCVYIIIVLMIIRQYIYFPLQLYFYEVVAPILMVVIVSGLLCLTVKQIVSDTIWGLVLMTLFSSILITMCIWLFGLQYMEKKIVKNFLKKFL